jgi:hypothetical protein
MESMPVLLDDLGTLASFEGLREGLSDAHGRLIDKVRKDWDPTRPLRFDPPSETADGRPLWVWLALLAQDRALRDAEGRLSQSLQLLAAAPSSDQIRERDLRGGWKAAKRTGLRLVGHRSTQYEREGLQTGRIVAEELDKNLDAVSR